MKKYDAYISKWFTIEKNEFIDLEKGWYYTREIFMYNMLILRNVVSANIIDFTIREIPSHLKKSKYDNARLLVVKYKSGEFFAKRFNTNQFLPLEFG